MDRKQMVTVLKEILDNCQETTSGHVMIMPSNANEITAKGEQLHMIAALDSQTKLCIEAIIKKYNLKMRDDENRIIIYEPKT